MEEVTGAISAGEEVTEVADQSVIGGEEQGVAEPAATETTAEAEVDASGGEVSGKKQSREEAAKFAATRRQKEIEQAKAQAADEVITALGLIDPYTKKNITTKAEYDEYKSRRESEQVEREFKRAGLSSEVMSKYVSNHPDVVKARELMAQLTQETEKTQQERARLKGEESLKEINKLDPSIRQGEDLSKQPYYPELRKLVMESGYTIVDAFKKVNEAKLSENAAARARQQALNNVNSKSHLQTSVGQGGGEGIVVPADIASSYRQAFPNITDAEMNKKYKRFLSYKRE